MRLSLMGFNAVAMGALVVPALLIYGSMSSSSGSDQLLRMAYLVSLGLGVLFLLGAMAKLTSRKAGDAGAAITLMLLGLGLVAVPLVLTFVLAFR
jgi:hypothetical protein